MWTKLLGVLIFSSWLCEFSFAETFAECGTKDNMYISSEQNCSHYIFCYGEESFEGDCEADAPYFSEVDQTCDTDASVCKNAPLPNEPSAAPPSEQDGDVDPQENPEGPIVNPPNPSAPSVSEGPIVNPPNPSAPSTVITVPPPVMSSTLTTMSSSSQKPATITNGVPSTTVAPTHIASECPLNDDPSKIVFLQDPKSCSDYFMCYHGEPLAMHCSNMLHFDLKTQRCDYPENVRCQLDSASPREKCQIHTVDVYPHPTNCNYYYMCRFGYLMVMQCPANMDWDKEKRACVLRSKAKCSVNVERTWIFKL